MAKGPRPDDDPAASAEGAPPLAHSYWVVPGKLLAGEHPGGATRAETQARLKRLIDAGITCFIDLTMPDELEPYDVDLPMSVDYIRKPIRDHGLPARREHMIEIQASLDAALRSGQVTYVHCRAGIGRTGMVIGCFLVEQGYSGPSALDELNRVWLQNKRSIAWPSVPETDEQCDYIRTWTPQLAALLSEHAPTPGEDPLLDSSTLSAARSLRERYLGALLGLAVGDAIAAATQYRKPGTFPPVGDLLGGGPFELPRGGWSDDTAMALCLAESLVESEGFNPRDQVERYTRWQQQGYLSATGQCLGITASTAKALAMAKWRRQVFSGSHDPTRLDPEVLSRIAPVVMYFFADGPTAVGNAAEAARTTCQSPVVLDACRLFGALMHGALAGKPKSALIGVGPDLPDPGSLHADIANVVNGLRSGREVTPSAGNAVEVLEAALWAFRSTDNFRDGVLKAANLGANADVVAAVFGQVAGAHYGAGAIPATWRNSLIGKDLIEGAADRLLARAMLSLGG